MQENVFVRNKKGLKLATIVERPSKKGKFPSVLMLHGFKGYKEEETYKGLAKILLKKNIASVRFDASGFGDSEGDFTKEYRLSNYVSDSESVYAWMIKQSFIDKKSIGVMGQSMGGALALIFSSNHPEIKAVVSVSAPDIFATRDDFGKMLGKWKKKGYIEIESSRMNGKIKVPFDYALDAARYDIKKYAAKSAPAKLFILGLDDVTVIPDQTRSVFNKAAKPKKLIEVKNMDHFYKNDPVILSKVNKYVVEYLLRYL